MRVIERYSTGVRVYRGRGAWSLLTPLRFILSKFYGAWLRGTAGRAVRGAVRPYDPGRTPLIVSVGNLEVGGGGKTPCTIELASAVFRKGGRPVVVTRGYRSRASGAGVPVIVPAGADVSPGKWYLLEDELAERLHGKTADTGAGLRSEILGDEVLLYRSRGIPVVIDSKRDRGVRAALELLLPTHILLDDAYQHRAARRDLDILLLDWKRPFGNGRLIPLGSLREPPEAADRADAILFTRAGGRSVPAVVKPFIGDRPVFFSRHVPDGLTARNGNLSLDVLEGRRIALFSGIARPASFEEIALSIGAGVDVSFRFADHHSYTRRDIRWMLHRAGSETTFLTTEKDWFKVADLFPDNSDLFALRVRMEIDGLDELLETAMKLKKPLHEAGAHKP